MIRETLNRKQTPAVTSDCWHVLRASWTGDVSKSAKFSRAVVSEHPDSSDAVRAARDLRAAVRTEMSDRTQETRDHFFVRAPGFKSLKTARRLRRRPH